MVFRPVSLQPPFLAATTRCVSDNRLGCDGGLCNGCITHDEVIVGSDDPMWGSQVGHWSERARAWQQR
eukprot:Skav201100  [mRNA]  locus=scaffold497:27367:29733:- [translate_table: standard]